MLLEDKASSRQAQAVNPNNMANGWNAVPAIISKEAGQNPDIMEGAPSNTKHRMRKAMASGNEVNDSGNGRVAASVVTLTVGARFALASILVTESRLAVLLLATILILA